MADTAIDTEASVVWRKGAVYGGRLLIVITLLGAWDYGARALGRLFFPRHLTAVRSCIEGPRDRGDAQQHQRRGEHAQEHLLPPTHGQQDRASRLNGQVPPAGDHR